MANSSRLFRIAAILAAVLMAAIAAPAHAQSIPDDAVRALAPTGKLRVGVLMVWYFALEDKAIGQLKGVIPDLGEALARRVGVPVELIKFENPGGVINAFRGGALDATFIGITADRAEAMDYGPTVIDLQTTFLVPAASPVTRIAEIDRDGLRILVPQRSAQEAHLRKIISKATLINVAVETPREAVDLIAAGKADAFSHVVPMLASAQPDLPGSRILPGSYYDVPIAIGYAKERPSAVAAYAKAFAEDVKKSGFVRQSLARAGDSVKGVVVATP